MIIHRCAFESSRWSDLPQRSFDGPDTMGLLFASPDIDIAPAVAELRRRLPAAKLLGCSTAGEIHQARVRDGTISAAFIRFEETRLRYASAEVKSDASSRAGADIAAQLAAPDLEGIIVLSEGIGVNGSELARGLNRALDRSVVVTGGLAGDGERFGSTWVLHDDIPCAGRVTALGLYGDRARIRHGSKGGWDIFGPERVVTRSEGNVLYELDGKPALALYKEYLGELARGLPTTALLFPLAILLDDGRRVVRTVLAIDEASQSMRFAGDVPEGQLCQLMRANFDRLVSGASEAALATATEETGPVLSIAISCVGRRLVLKGRIEEEVEATLDVLPPQAEQVGFYSYGELSSTVQGSCELHNQTMTLTTIAEAV